MGAGPVSAPETGGSWKLDPQIAPRTQGMVVSGFTDLPCAMALFLRYPDIGGSWLADLRAVAPITAADGPQSPAATIAFTYAGLSSLGLRDEDVSGFQAPFKEGMLEPNRRRRLGDEEEFVPNRPIWSSNRQTAANGVRTELEVEALLILYESTHAALDAHVARVEATLTASGVQIVRRKRLDLRLDARGVAIEHFGFSDGVSQPIPYGEGTAAPHDPPDPVHGVPLGEVLLGYPNAHHENAPGPIILEALPSQAAAGSVRSRARLANFAASPKAAALRDLGRNGSYLVVRELKQDVDAFWTGMKAAADALNAKVGDAAPPVDADWIAERVVGRTKAGHLLCPGGHVPARPGGVPDNSTLFSAEDTYGFGCPMGSHVRRANPRDGLAAKPSQRADLLAAANAHRILRRGRKFDESEGADAADSSRGLLFMCLNTDIARQFEFVQQNWLFNPNFATLLGERDPLVGPKTPFTIPHEPLRRKVEVDTYVTLVGGDYFFLPSLDALDYFETLTP